MPPAVRLRFQSTCPIPAFRQTSPDSAPGPASPRADNQIPALPADPLHTAIQIVGPPGTGSCCEPAEYSTPACAPLATHPLPQLRSSAPEARPAPPTGSPAARLQAPAGAADCCGT